MPGKTGVQTQNELPKQAEAMDTEVRTLLLAAGVARMHPTVDGDWIAGDVRPMTPQVAISLGTGNIAAGGPPLGFHVPARHGQQTLAEPKHFLNTFLS